MKRNNKRLLALALAVLLCFSVLTVPAFAEPGETIVPLEPVPEDTAAPVDTDVPIEPEPTEPEPTEPLPTEPVMQPEETDTEPVQSDVPEERGMFRFTPDGSMTLVDDFEYVGMDERGNVLSKQFITVQDRSGKYFFIIIDRTGDSENVYFLNQVDLSDLKTVANSSQQTLAEETCTCKSHCTVGHIDTSCPVCSVNMTECMGADVTPTRTDSDTPETTEPETSPEKESKQQLNPVTLIVLVAVIGVVAAVYFVKKKRGGKKAKPSDFDYDEDDEEYEAEEDAPEDGK